MNKTNWIIIGIIVVGILLNLYFYPLLPNSVASHWNVAGEVDGYLSKEIALGIMPLISIALFALFLALPKLDPLRKNVLKFQDSFNLFLIVLFGFLLYINALTIAANLIPNFNLIGLLMPAFAALFYSIGHLLKRAEMNWFIGIRTPWTLSNPVVWKQTHVRGALLFKICAIFALFGSVFSAYAIWLVLIPIILSVIYLFAFSYSAFKKISAKAPARKIKKK